MIAVLPSMIHPKQPFSDGLGGGYDNYASQSKDERALFLSDLEAKKYSRLLYLLTQSDYRFEKIKRTKNS